ncbi:MAG: hypothetical protein JWR85_3671, partial [Marmoricola sp.]|nr:hypothetical protein [Marmoricola sp.]
QHITIMDFLDPKKQRAHLIRLYVGYVLIGLAILIATMILLYWASGFGFDKQGKVVQNGLVFVSSQPDKAQISLSNELYKDATNTRLQLNEGNYSLTVKKNGYRSWHREIEVSGSTVTRYDYPLLVPNDLTPSPVRNYSALPAFATQSPDRKWAVVQEPGSLLNFDVYDLSDPKKVGDSAIKTSLPATLMTSATVGDRSWKLLEWSTNNRHVILEHAYSGGSEYILVDREKPDESVNLTKTLQLDAGQVLSLRDKKFDKYYVFDPAAKTVVSVDLSDPTVKTPVLSGVLAFKSYGADMLLYATETDAPAGKVMTMLRDGDVTYKIRELATGAPYLLDLAQYDGDWFVAVGANAENKTYVFKNPQAVRKAGRVKVLVPVQVLRVTAPNFLAFSSNTRFIMIENATSFAVYDAETDKGYTYATAKALDAPQAHANWMDGHRLMYVSGNKIVIFDYDNINFQELVTTTPALMPFFDRDYRYVYTLTPPATATGQSILMSTSLLTPADR